MRGIRSLVALAFVLFVVAGAQATSYTFGVNQTYTFGNRTITIVPFTVNGTIFVENGNTRIWSIKDCMTSITTQTCLKTASDTQATFEETNLAAILKAQQHVDTATTRAGDSVTGLLTITNSGKYTAKNVVASVHTNAPCHFRDDTTDATFTSAVSKTAVWTPQYEFTRDDNGTCQVSVSIDYDDGNTTQTITATNVTATFTIPFKYVYTYNPETVALETLLQFNVTKISTNLTTTTRFHFPPEVNVTNHTKTLYDDGHGLYDVMDYLNGTTLALYNVTYFFHAPPSAPLIITITYSEPGEPTHSIDVPFPYQAFNQSDPTIGFSLDNISANTTGRFSISIFGNVTGVLSVHSPIVNDSVNGAPSTYDFVTAPAPIGTYPLVVTYEWTDRYGGAHTASGNTVITVTNVTDAADAPEEWVNVDSNATETNTTTNSTGTHVVLTQPDEANAQLLLWILGGTAIGCLCALWWLLHRMRDPLRKVEGLLRRTAELRAAIAKRNGTMTTNEQAQLDELEEHLDALNKTLR